MNTPVPPPEKDLLHSHAGHPMENTVRINAANPQYRLRGLFVFAALLTAAFALPLGALMVYASGKDLHSHILLIPFVSAYLIYINRSQLPADYQTSPVAGALLTLTGLATVAWAWHWRGSESPLSQNDQHVLPVLAYLFLLTSGGFWFLGRKWMAAAVFPVCFLIFMVPLPDPVADSLETASQYASAEAAAFYFKLTGMPFLQEGTLFELPGFSFVVAQECSGIRSSFVLLITSLVASQMFLKSNWRRAIFVLLVIPLGILRNGFRILVIGWLCVEVGPHMIDHWIHHKGGPVFFALSLIPLFGILWWLRRGEIRKANRLPAGAQQPIQIVS